MSLLDLACSVPWLMDESSLRGVLAVADRQHDPAWLIEARKGARVPGARLLENRNGVAVIQVNGPIFRHADLFTEICGGTTTARLAQEFTLAVESGDFHSILLNIDSPGGEAAGIEEFAAMIRERRGTKPITAYVESLGASAAYWIASAADEIVVGKTAFVGSIGAVMTYRDDSQAKAARGINDIEFVSAVSPNKRPDITTDEGKAQIQKRVDDLGSVFVDAVATNRGVPRDTVLNDFGAGGVLMGKAAVKAGMADRIGTFEKTLKRLVSRGGKPQSSSSSLSTSNHTMTLKTFVALLGMASKADSPDLDDLDLDASADLDPEPTPTASGPSPEFAAMRAKLDSANAKLKAISDAQETARVEAHEKALDACAQAARDHVATLSDRLTPQAAVLLEGVLTQAGIDDLAGGTRTASLREFLDALPEHGLLSETALDEGERVVPLTADSDDEPNPIMDALNRRFATQ